MSREGDSSSVMATNVATAGSIIIILITVMVTMNTTLNYSGPLANASSSATVPTSAQTSATARSPPVIDGQSESLPGICQPSLTTSKPNDVLILFVGAQSSGPLVRVNDSAGLTWNRRASSPYNLTNTFETVEEWYATSVLPLSKDNITIRATSAGAFHCFVLGVSGANLVSPFDPSVGCSPDTAVPRSAASSTGSINATVSICTSNSNDLLVTSLWAGGSYEISSVPSTFTFLAGGGMNSFNEAYKQVSTKQTDLPVTWTFFGGADSWGVIVDAIAAGNA